MADDEYDLIIAAQGGDQAAFDALVHLHQAWVRGFISRYVNNPEDVFDVAQEVFIEVYRSLKRYDPERSFNAWLRGVAYNRVKLYFRTEKRRRTGPNIPSPSIHWSTAKHASTAACGAAKAGSSGWMTWS
ncbi:RNA polymerase sigma factor [Planctomycetota bacterium]